MSKKSGTVNKLFQTGYKAVRKRMNEYRRGLMSCQTCNFFYQGENDDYDVCHNNNVTRFEVVETEFGTTCSLWQPVNDNNEVALKHIGEKISEELESNLRIISRNFSARQKARMKGKD